jgi:hypothetical protein
VLTAAAKKFVKEYSSLNQHLEKGRSLHPLSSFSQALCMVIVFSSWCFPSAISLKFKYLVSIYTQKNIQ